MAKWKKLPETEHDLLELLQNLKDKEMRLEADLAIKDHPELETPIAHLALSIAEVKKLDSKVVKIEKPVDKAKEVSATVNRLQFLFGQLETSTAKLMELMPNDGKTLLGLAEHRQAAMCQLAAVHAAVAKKFAAKGVPIEEVIPSVSDFVGS